MSNNMQALRALMAASKVKDNDAFLALMTDDIEYYWYMHARPIIGKTTMRKFLINYQANFEQRDWTITHALESGDMMMVEGVEQIYDRSRAELINNPFMQAIEFKDGKICKMRDYYDASKVQAPVRKPATADATANAYDVRSRTLR